MFFYITGNISPTITGLYITGGDATGLGGGFFSGDYGGGVYAITATLTISDCSIYSNLAGGGVSIEFPVEGLVQNNTFYSNHGGGLSIENGEATVRENVFRANEGGGVNIFGSNSMLYGNLVAENRGQNGGGMWLAMFGGNLARNVIVSNTAEGNGGGVFFFGNGTGQNNVIADNHAGNSGGALYTQPGGPELVHTTISRNSSGDGSAIYVASLSGWEGSDVKLINTIFVSHSVGISVTTGQTVTVDTVLWYGTPVKVSSAPGSKVTIINEMDGDPAFAVDGYHLTANSAAIDKGLDVGVEEDIDLEPRPAGEGYDLGADEFWYKINLPLVQRDIEDQ